MSSRLGCVLRYGVFWRGLRPLRELAVDCMERVAWYASSAKPAFRALETPCPSVFFVDRKSCAIRTPLLRTSLLRLKKATAFILCDSITSAALREIISCVTFLACGLRTGTSPVPAKHEMDSCVYVIGKADISCQPVPFFVDKKTCAGRVGDCEFSDWLY
jgi:hypothetical protein